MNVIDATKELLALISASGTNDNVWKSKHDYYWHSMPYLYYRKIKFQKGHTTEIRLELQLSLTLLVGLV